MSGCAQCGRDDLEAYRLHKCPQCFKMVCEGCAERLYGRYFCSRDCALAFFHSYDEELEEDR